MQDTEATIATPRGPQGAGRAARDRRLRHRLLVAQLPPPVPDRRAQDRPLVRRGAGEGPEQAAVVVSILRLARRSHLDTVAEGIEDTAELAQLRTLGADLGQGFLFDRPLTADAIAERLVQAATPRADDATGSRREVA